MTKMLSFSEIFLINNIQGILRSKYLFHSLYDMEKESHQSWKWVKQSRLCSEMAISMPVKQF